MEHVSTLTREKNLELGREFLGTHDGPKLERNKKKTLLQILQKSPAKSRLADVGCFDGRFFELYRQAGFLKVDGFDANTDALGVARSRGMEVSIWDFESGRAPVDSGSYDAVVCADVLEHVYNTENLVSECHRILRVGGLCVFCTPNLVSLWNRTLAVRGKMPRGHPGVSVNSKTEGQVNLGHARMGNAREWTGLLAKGGFEVERLQGIWETRVSRALSLSRATLADALIFTCKC